MIKNRTSTIPLASNEKTKKEKPLLQPGDVPATYTDIFRLMEDFDYKPDTSHKKGIARFIKSYKSFYTAAIH